MIATRVTAKTSGARRFGRRTAAGIVCSLTFLLASACSDGPTGPGFDPTALGLFLLITSVPNESGADGASFVQTVDLDQPQVDNTNAFEQTFRPYPYVNGDDVIILQGLFGDQAVRYVRGADGQLSEAGRMSLPPGGAGAAVVYASDTKAYLSLAFAGRVLIFNPQTMTTTGEIDLTALDIARNPPNPDDINPEPVLLAVRDGKLFVTLHQLVNGFSSADGTDIAVFDVATDTFEKVIHDARTATPGTFGYNQSFFVDPAGDIYVYGAASYGFVPGQTGGILRIRSGETEFDPTYFFDLSVEVAGVPGGRFGFMALPTYHDGSLYGVAEVPALTSNPPNFVEDRNFQAVRLNLATQEISVLPLPLSDGVASGAAVLDGQIIFGLSTTTGVGLYSYDPSNGEVSDGPVVNTAGSPTHLLRFQQ